MLVACRPQYTDDMIVYYGSSVWGSQNVMSMARYRAIAADRAVRACSRQPILAYSMPRPRWQWAWSELLQARRMCLGTGWDWDGRAYASPRLELRRAFAAIDANLRTSIQSR